MAGVTVTTNGGTAVMAADAVGAASSPGASERIPYQKLDHGAAGSSSPVTVLNPLPVGQKIEWIQITPTLDTSIYASGDLLFDVTTITSAALGSGGAVELVSCVVTDEDEQGTAIDIYLTSSSTSWGSLNAAVAATDAMSRSIQAYVPIAAADFKDIGGALVAMPTTSKNMGIICETSGSANLYAVGIVRSGTPTYTASGVRISLGFRQTAVS